MSALETSKMPDEEFLGAIKLVTGEELLATVCPVYDEDGEYIIVENPIEVEQRCSSDWSYRNLYGLKI